MHLAIVDTTGIQPYIFGSNALSENIGASYLVAQATGPWALECVRQAFSRHNVKEDLTLDEGRHIEGDGLDAEVIYAGGGNIALLCREISRWKAFERSLSKKVLAEAPGIQLVTAHVPCDFDRRFLREGINDLFQALFEKKRAHVPSAPLQGLGVTRAGRSTGRPAVGVGDDGEGYSAEVLAKQRAAGRAHHSLKTTIAAPEGFDYPKQFDRLGRSEGAQSYMAVVHADGNSMGRRIRAIGKDYGEAEMSRRNRKYVREIRAFSRAVDEAALAAQRTMLERLAAGVDREEGVIRHAVEVERGADEVERGAEYEIARVELQPSGQAGEWLLPFRPLVYGGDDLTFVCDGRLGITLALLYMREFEKETRKRAKACGGAITASAGVSIVKTHYPFARAYQMAEELTSSAKHLRRIAQKEDENWDHACLDWHFSLGGLAGSIDSIRRREYRAQKRARRWLPLTLRPVAVGAEPPEAPGKHAEPEAQQWEVVEAGVRGFQEPGWLARRNKIKRLREALRQGAAEVEAFTEALSATSEDGLLPPLPLSGGDVEQPRKDGWAGRRCAYFDAIELADFFIPEKALN